MKDAVDKILKKLLDDGVLEYEINSLREGFNLEPIAKDYIKSVLNIIASPRDNQFDICNSFEQVILGMYGGIVYRKMDLVNIGDIVNSHSHSYDHFTYVEKGIIDINGEIYKAGQWAKVPKEVIHTIKALTNDCVAYCINSEYEAMKDQE